MLVDEYQDTNRLQASILLALKPGGRGLTVVGDDAQSIYSFRAATVRNILDFPSQFSPQAAIITLDRNYRSTQPILTAANGVIDLASERFTKNLWTDRTVAERPQLVGVRDENDQTDYIVARVLENREGGTMVGPTSAQRVLDRMTEAADPIGALAGAPSPPQAGAVWTAFVETVTDLNAGRAGWPAELERARLWYEPHLDRIHEDSGTRHADLIQLEQIANGYPSRERFLTELTLDPPDATSDQAGVPLLDEDYLILSTIHSAKGQEWKSVFVLNVVDGCIPSDTNRRLASSGLITSGIFWGSLMPTTSSPVSSMRATPAASVAAAYFGGPHHLDVDAAREVARSSVPIIPTVGPSGDFGAQIPDFLRASNGLRRRADDPKLTELAVALLECVGLLRRQRQVFVSYRRIESRTAAMQLHDLLTERGFDVTHDIRPGEPFQDVLWHRLCDSDVMVMLDTPTYFESKWTRQEIGRARAKEIHVLRVVWPEHKPSKDHRFG